MATKSATGEPSQGRLFYSYKAFMVKHHGGPLHRVPVDLGFGCPNRDADGGGGCAFCDADGSRARQTVEVASVGDQVRQAIRFAQQRYRATRFMAYIQAFTGTFAPVAEQREAYRSVLAAHVFDALSIGTRPDCLSPATLDLLASLNEELETWVELGVQTMHDSTLARINRGHDWAASVRAIGELKRRRLRVAPHIIVGLPGEDRDMVMATVDALAALPVDAIKIHNLHVVEGTRLATEFRQCHFPVLSARDYAEMLMEILRRLPPTLPVMRLTTDTPSRKLVAPHWTMSKGAFIQFLKQQMRARGIRQGDRFAPSTENGEGVAWTPLPTDDGSITFWSQAFKEHYHARVGARTEAEEKFVRPAKLAVRLANGPVRLLDVCFGLGYNALCAADVAARLRSHRLEIVGLEIDPAVVEAVAEALVTPEAAAFDWRGCLGDLAAGRSVSQEQFSLRLLMGDARHTVSQAGADGCFDIVFLDAFSTQRNSELWTIDFLTALRGVMAADGVLLTYCAALPVRAGLLAAGFHVGQTEPIGRQRGGTIASPDPACIERPLDPGELETIRLSSRGVPYRDPDGTWTNRQILRQRQMAIEAGRDQLRTDGGQPEAFTCKRCGACCRWPGPVRVTDAEIRAIADFLEMPLAQFIEYCTIELSDGRGRSLCENPGGVCMFLEADNSCEIQAVKPEQCRTFPVQWQAGPLQHLCQGRNRPVTP